MLDPMPLYIRDTRWFGKTPPCDLKTIISDNGTKADGGSTGPTTGFCEIRLIYHRDHLLMSSKPMIQVDYL